jgi:hypothetical protein
MFESAQNAPGCNFEAVEQFCSLINPICEITGKAKGPTKVCSTP